MTDKQFAELMVVLNNIAFSVEFARHDITRIAEDMESVATDVHSIRCRLQRTLIIPFERRKVSWEDEGTAVLEDEPGVEIPA